MVVVFSKADAPRIWKELIARLGVLLCLCILFSNSNALATGDNGLLIGSGRLHPYIQTEAHYVLNPHRIPPGKTSTQGPLFVLKPGTDFIQPSNTFQLKFNGYAELRYYAIDLMSDLPLLAGSAKLDLSLNKESTLPIIFSAGFRRTDNPASQAVSYSLTNDLAQLSMDGTWKPDGGALSVRLRLPLDYLTFGAGGAESNRLQAYKSAFGSLDHLNISPILRIAWKFFPKTAVVFDAFGTYTHYTESTSKSTDMDFGGVSLGVMGAITPKISTIIKAGWAQPILASQFSTDAQTFVGQLDVGYIASQMMEFTVGMGREAKASPLYNYHKDYYGKAGILLKLGTQLVVDVDFEFRFIEFGSPSDQASNFKPRSDVVAKPLAVVSYIVKDWLTLSLHNRFEYRDTGEYSAIGNPDLPPVNGSYVFYDAFFRIDARY
uniref:Uncharacterized protein n=1 Tax=uncultured myxobacterium HF0200_19H16 TaxID=723559 RepID=E7C3V8_9BACT|nr:hypothetical protein [uncultured myxobacterium HF0200_19H16]